MSEDALLAAYRYAKPKLDEIVPRLDQVLPTIACMAELAKFPPASILDRTNIDEQLAGISTIFLTLQDVALSYHAVAKSLAGEDDTSPIPESEEQVE